MNHRFFLNNIELILSAFGVLLIVGIPLVLPLDDLNIWQVTAIMALVIGLVHGAIFWSIRRRQRSIRAETIQQIREMLNDVVKNQLAVISINAHLAHGEEKRVEKIQQTVKQIAVALDHISDEDLHHWRTHYLE